MDGVTTEHSTDSVLAGGGEMGALMRALDWSKTPLGPVGSWPQSLRSVLGMLLPSKAQIILFWGPDFICFYNDAYRPVFGAKHPHALGCPGREAWSEIWDTVLHDLLDGVVRTGEAFWGQDLLFALERHGFAEETYFDVSYDPVRVESGEVGGVYCIVTETTERVVGGRRMALLKDLAARQTTARTTSEAYALAMEILASQPQDIVFALAYDDHGLQACTPGAEAMLASTSDDQIRELSVFSAGVDKPTGRLVVGLSPLRPYDDHYRAFLELVASQLGSSVASARAYEEERKRAEALAEIDRAKTVFFSNVSHEFRTPLTLILGPVEDMLTDSTMRSTIERSRIELVHRNSLRLLKLVNTLLDFSRIEAGRVQAVYQPTDLSTLTADLASAFRSTIERAEMELVVHCPPLDEPVYVDRDMWEKIVLNLVSNAFKYTLEGRITVSLRKDGSSIELSVEDTGVGIPERELPHIFTRFHRVEGSRGRTHEGTGIGLALVQELARWHGGSVGVVSRVGAGSTFTVRIPSGTGHLAPERLDEARSLSSTALGATPYVAEALLWLPHEQEVNTSGDVIDTVLPAARAAGSSVARAHVLLADDNSDMRDYLHRLLSAEYDVESVGDGAAALAAARRHRPDLILADVMMPVLDGFGLIRELRGDAELRGVPVMLLSARAGEEARVEGWGAGADDYLVKPFSARELLARVESHLTLTRVRREANEALQLSLESAQEARAEAQRANRMKDEFLTMLSHELRTPLNAILGWSQILSANPNLGPDTVRQGLETIERSTRMQAQLIEDLLDVSRITEGKLRLDVRRVSLCEVVEAALASVRPAADAKSLKVQTLLDRQSDHVNGDPARLQQVVWNLLSNAVKFTTKGGHIQVMLKRVNSQVELSVSDDGEGIDAEFLPYVFERFRQADQTTTRSVGGLGLGLSIVKHLVEMHGGTVRVMSPGKGKGTSFAVELPLSLLHEEDAGGDAAVLLSPGSLETLKSAGTRLDGVTVLYVDDEPDARALVRRILSDQGARVLTAGSAEEGRRVMASDRPDILVADIGMPIEDGYSLIRTIRALPSERGGSIPAAAVTALARSEDRRRALLAGFHTHLAKPVDVVELVAVVASLTGRTGR